MIEIVDQRTDLDCCVRLYRRAIYNILLALKPKYCLEIGTHLYQTSKVFSRYLQEHQPEGKLITTDIGEFNRDKEPPPRVYPLMVYPYTRDVQEIHGGLKVFREDWKSLFDEELADPLIENESIIEEEMERVEIPKICTDIYDSKQKLHTIIHARYFEFVFVDGDHREFAIKQDLDLAKRFTTDGGYILIDDIEDRGHEQYNYYQNYLKPKNPSFYEIAGMGLIQNKDLIL